MPNKIKTNQPVVIIGGGPTGLTAAYKLSEMGKRFVLIEKEKYLGGLSATLKRDGFLYEFGPHAFHLKDPEIIRWIKNLLGRDFRIIPTNTHVLIDDQLYSYPLTARDLLKKIRLSLGLKILVEYLLSYLKNIVLRTKPTNFQEWGVSNFGPTLYQMSFGHYTKKVWGVDPQKLSTKLASQKLSRLNLADIIVKLLGFRGQNQPAYFRQYLYPKDGIKIIFQKMTEKIRLNGQIILGAEVIKLKNIQGRIKEVEYRDFKGKIGSLLATSVISTITVKDLARLINKPLTKKALCSSEQLKYRDMIIVYLVTCENNSLLSSQWIYLVEDRFKFNRLAIGKNLSYRLAPKNKTVLAFEVCCQKGDFLWRKSNRALANLALEDLRKLRLDSTKVTDYFVEKVENAYPIYLKNFEKSFENTMLDIRQISNLISTGRNGLFLNSDIHDCFKMGFEAAEAVADKNLNNWYKKAGKWLGF